jgi:hypothetical protein
MVLYEPISKGGKTMKTNNKTLVESYKKTAKGFEVKTWVFDKETNMYRTLTVPMPNNSITEEALIKMIEENALSLAQVKKESLIRKNLVKQSQNGESNNTSTTVVAKKEKSNNTIAKIALVGVLALGGYVLVKDGPTWFNGKQNIVTNDPTNEVDEEQDIVVTEKFFKEELEKNVTLYESYNMNITKDEIAASMMIANIESLDEETLEKLVNGEVLNKVAADNLNLMNRLAEKVRHNNNLYSLGKTDKFVSVEPLFISSKAAKNNILHSEALMKEMLSSDNLEDKMEYFKDFHKHSLNMSISGTNYTSMANSKKVVGYDSINRFFFTQEMIFGLGNSLGDVDNKTLLDPVSKEIAELEAYSRNAGLLFNYLLGFDDCFVQSGFENTNENLFMNKEKVRIKI